MITLDLNEKFPGKPDPTTFGDRVDAFDFSPYTNQHVQLAGCAPTWAHLQVAARLFSHTKMVDFLIDDGKDGIVVAVLR